MFPRPVSCVWGIGVILVGSALPAAGAVSSNWGSASAGNWNVPGNWSPNAVPNGVGDSATFNQDIAAATSITLDTDVTLGALTMRDGTVNNHGSHSWSIIDPTSTYKLIFDNGGAGATISAGNGGGGSHTISVPIVLNDNLTVGGPAWGSANSIQLALTGGISSGAGETTGLTLNAIPGRAMTLGGTNTYTGATVITAGARVVLPDGDANVPATSMSMTGAALVLGNSKTLSRDFSITGSNQFTAAGFGGSAAFSGDISGTGTFVLQLPGGFGPATTITLSGDNTYSGGTVINNSNATLRLGKSDTLPDTGAVTIFANATDNGNTLNLNNFNETIGALASARLTANTAATQAKVNLGTGTLTTGDVTDTTFEGVISGAGGKLVKQGSGAFTLTNANTYTGGTTVNAGTLKVSNTAGSASGAGAVLVNANGTLAGSGFITGPVTIDGGTLSPGSGPGTLTLGASDWNGAGDYNWQIHDAAGAAGTGYDLLAINGTLDVNDADGFAINLWSLSAVGPDVNGDALNFDGSQDYAWTIASTTGGVIGFDDWDYVINASATNGAGGFTNALPPGGTFGLTLGNAGKDLVLTYTVVPIPEPVSGALLALGGVMMITRPRR